MNTLAQAGEKVRRQGQVTLATLSVLTSNSDSSEIMARLSREF